MDNSQKHPPLRQAQRWILPLNLQEEGWLKPLSRRQLRRWELVLQARGISFYSEPVTDGWRLLVLSSDFDQAREELRLYEEENHNWPPPLPPEREQSDNVLTSLSVLLLVAIFYNLSQLDINLLGHHPVDWVALGNAYSGKIFHGQWWRLLTSLTLHADGLHLLGNLVIGGLFIVRLCRELGSGLGWSLLLTGGLLGNLLNALLQPSDHRSIGASTAVFAAVGLLAAIGVVRRRCNLRRRRLLPAAAALALLALLGSSGEHTDVGAHLFGLLSGFVLGLGAEYLVRYFGRPGVWLNRLFCLGSAALISFAWWAALIWSS